MLGRLGRFFDTSASIQVSTVTRATNGEELQSWATVDGLANVPCSMAPAVRESPNQAEIRGYERSYIEHEFHALLRGYYPEITAVNRATVREVAYEITSVEHDSHALTTRLRLRKVTR